MLCIEHPEDQTERHDGQLHVIRGGVDPFPDDINFGDLPNAISLI